CQAANFGGNDYAETVAFFEIVYIDSAVCNRRFGCGHCQMRKPVRAPHVLWIFEEQLGIEIADLAADFAIIPASVKSVDCTVSADTVLQILPKRLKSIANRRDNNHTSDDYSAFGHDEITLRLKPKSVSWFPCRRFARSGRVSLQS